VVVVGVVVVSSVVVVVGDDAPPQETISITAIIDKTISDRDNDLPIFLLLYHVKECRSNLIIHILLFMYNIIQITHRTEAKEGCWPVVVKLQCQSQLRLEREMIMSVVPYSPKL
jgi:hypothetical protein